MYMDNDWVFLRKLENCILSCNGRNQIVSLLKKHDERVNDATACITYKKGDYFYGKNNKLYN